MTNHRSDVGACLRAMSDVSVSAIRVIGGQNFDGCGLAALGTAFRLIGAIVALLPLGLRGAEEFAKLPNLDALTAYFSPLRTDRAALSPDGKFVAYTIFENNHTSIAICSVASPDALVVVPAGERVTFLQWANAERLVYSCNNTDIAYLNTTSVGLDLLAQQNAMAKSLGDHATEIRSVDYLGKNNLTLATEADTHTTQVTLAPIYQSEYEPNFSNARESLGTLLTSQRLPPDIISNRPIVEGFSAIRENAIIVSMTETPLVRYLAINVLTGKQEVTFDDTSPNSNLLADKTGVPRIRVNHTVPQSVFYSAAKGKKWDKLDHLFPNLHDLHFDVTGENGFGPRSLPLAFDYNREVLYFASNVGRDTFGIYGFDLHSGKRTEFIAEDPAFDLVDPLLPFPSGDLIWDRFNRRLVGVRFAADTTATKWVDRDLAAVQGEIEKIFPHKIIEISEWDSGRHHFLFLATRDSDPGKFYIFDRPTAAVTQIVRRNPSVEDDEVNRTQSFRIPHGTTTVTGYLTHPAAPIASPSPVLVYLHDGPWQRDLPGSNPDVQALAAMGFTVVQVNYAGSAGLGFAHLKSIQPGFDRVPLAEILAAVEWMAAQQSPRPGKVAIMGEGFGGFLALRAIQLHPETFSCAVAINAILNLNDEMNYLTQRQPTVASQAKASFLKQSASSFEESAIIRHPDVLTKPILFVLNPNNRASVSMVTQIIRTLYIGVDQTRTLYATMRNEGRDVDYFEIDRDFDRRDPAARANAYSKIEGFLAAHLYDFKVEVGEPKTVP